MKRILITGGTGFIGKALCESLKNTELEISLSYRKNRSLLNENIESFKVEEINSETDWSKALHKTDCVIHCAGRAHMNKEIKKNTLDIYRKINVKGTINLAKQAATLGVKRLIFLSSIKVNGERTVGSLRFKHDDVPKPEDAYGISKLEAEKGLYEISKKTGLEIVIIRAPLVYGPGVKGNLKRLIKLIKSRIPLPFSSINNKRSLIGIDNLVDIITNCINNTNAAGKTFLVSDDQDISTPELFSNIALAMKCKLHLFPLPIIILNFFFRIIRRKNEIDRLTGSLQVDINYTKRILNWKPILSFEEGIRKMVKSE